MQHQQLLGIFVSFFLKTHSRRWKQIIWIDLIVELIWSVLFHLNFITVFFCYDEWIKSTAAIVILLYSNRMGLVLFYSRKRQRKRNEERWWQWFQFHCTQLHLNAFTKSLKHWNRCETVAIHYTDTDNCALFFPLKFKALIFCCCVRVYVFSLDIFFNSLFVFLG